MTYPQISRAARRSRRREQFMGATRARHTDDPHLCRMLTTHIHCGEHMQLVIANPAQPNRGSAGTNDGGLVTYRCACGFSFDQWQN
jgi:hypothetical protein